MLPKHPLVATATAVAGLQLHGAGYARRCHGEGQSWHIAEGGHAARPIRRRASELHSRALRIDQCTPVREGQPRPVGAVVLAVRAWRRRARSAADMLLEIPPADWDDHTRRVILVTLPALAFARELARRLDRLEGEVRTGATTKSTPAPMGMGLYGVKRP